MGRVAVAYLGFIQGSIVLASLGARKFPSGVRGKAKSPEGKELL